VEVAHAAGVKAQLTTPQKDIDVTELEGVSRVGLPLARPLPKSSSNK